MRPPARPSGRLRRKSPPDPHAAESLPLYLDNKYAATDKDFVGINNELVAANNSTVNL